MREALKTLAVLQHTSSEYLGLLEDELESRRIRFRYFRPFTSGGRVPHIGEAADGLVLLGGGPWSVCAGARQLPSLDAELALTVAALEAGITVIGIGLGAQILALAAGGAVRSAPLEFEVSVARCAVQGALFGGLPQEYPLVRYGPDRLTLPPRALTLAREPGGEPALFKLGERAFGFTGHPGIKSAIIEDLIMEFPDSPAETAAPLATLRAKQAEVRASLASMMVGLTRALGLMAPALP
ncbi:MAG: type 1 glutamine amidotransferase [Steroidobacteraceae bacterium]